MYIEHKIKNRSSATPTRLPLISVHVKTLRSPRTLFRRHSVQSEELKIINILFHILFTVARLYLCAMTNIDNIFFFMLLLLFLFIYNKVKKDSILFPRNSSYIIHPYRGVYEENVSLRQRIHRSYTICGRRRWFPDGSCSSSRSSL